KTRARLLRIQRAEQQRTDLLSALLLLSRNGRGHGNTDVAKVAEQLFDAHRGPLGSKPLDLRLAGGPGPAAVDAPEAAVAGARGHGNTDVAKVAEQLCDARRGQLGSKALGLRLEGGPGQVVVDAPESAVTVALGNLVGNAVKYTRQGEVVVRLKGNAVEVVG